MIHTRAVRARAGRRFGAALIVALTTATAAAGIARADGTETLGAPSIPIADGSGVVAAGTGLVTQPGTIDLDVPGTVEQALLYWEGMSTDGSGDATIVVNGTEVTGTLIGGPTLFFPTAYSSTYRADITSLGLVDTGGNSLSVSGLAFNLVNDGAGLLVIYDDGTTSEIGLVDGNDLAFRDFASPLDTTVPQTFTFAPAATERTADVAMFFSSVAGGPDDFGERPSVIEITVGGTVTTVVDVLDSIDGREWDTLTVPVTVPAGADSITIQALSEDRTGSGNLPASFAWNAASVSVPVATTPPAVLGRMTGGGSNFTASGVRVTKGFQIHCDLRDPNNLEVNWAGGNRFHLEDLTSAVCTDEDGYDEAPPDAGFDTFVGVGTGRLNGTLGATIEFRFEDHGEPGRNDIVSLTVRDAGGAVVLEVVEDALNSGNLQAHEDQP